jgi:hypothetical protein
MEMAKATTAAMAASDQAAGKCLDNVMGMAWFSGSSYQQPRQWCPLKNRTRLLSARPVAPQQPAVLDVATAVPPAGKGHACQADLACQL